jgi:cellulose synthase/poly-beta-1,6-N-acetylglucosamine synthase-like glycosyltransferase
MNPKQPTLSIGIPSHELGESLIKTLHSLYPQSTSAFVKEIILITDGKKVPPDLLAKIAHPKLRIIQTKTRLGQSQRLNDLFSAVKGEYFLSSNDDVIFEKNALREIQKHLKNTPDLLTLSIRPLPPRTFVEAVLTVGNDLTHVLSERFGNFQNYLACNGRALVLSKRFLKILQIPRKVWNNDAYIYMQCEKEGFHHVHSKTAKVYFRVPNNLHEHIRQHQKFARSQMELQPYFDSSLQSSYRISPVLKLEAALVMFSRRPMYSCFYICLQLYISLLDMLSSSHATPANRGFWPTDKSTKQI